ncbi:enoyl-CoA hydratase/isomerase family protein [Caulobacter sp. NIBR2454]|uniref:enoyl-CoA hydratase/isomerase family protein n=1 Tax=Caulobacter sp. NIBR2454 TaxID=3015996 RepID=UPI0022B5ED64|nr:enoyl-CoA hydratase/isomerase family protein [Caulobacter sp. NIBR2454]
MSAEPEVITRIEGKVGRITLNRPKALHALNLGMCEAMIAALQAWRNDPAVALVMIDHAGERGFCAGGDIRILAESGAKDGVEAMAFFHTEYRLNHLLFTYEKPVVAVMDGIVMGGGVGLAMPCAYRIATERTTFAMPETGIGLFPDVGGGWFLPRLPGKTGFWLALTGARIKAADCLILGIATDYVHAADLETLKSAIIADPADIEGLLAQIDADPGHAPLADNLAALSETFTMTSVEGIVAALEAHGSDWAGAQLETLRTKSPQTLKVAFRQLRRGGAMDDFAENMAMEYAIGARVVRRHDFIEGVRAVIVDKDNAPKWNPDRLGAVTESMLDEIFAPLPPDQAWTPLT